MLVDYKQKKENVLNIFEEYKKIMNNLNEEIPRGIEFKAKNIKNDKFILMVAGEAKSGKSTFINAYLGKPILPMDVKQCTSAIIEIEYGDRYKLIAMYAGGKTREFNEEKKIEDFLRTHAALKDDYRDIPIAAINYELLIKYKGNPSEGKINDLINGVKDDNLYSLSNKEYEKRIRDYIVEYKIRWKDIVTDIKIKWPLEESLKGITIIDSPGINAIGKVGEITESYIEKANAIIFVKSLSGQALSSVAFKKFLDTKAADKHKETIFLVLTGAADKSQQDLNKLLSEAKRIYNDIPQKRIINVDSKIQLILNKCLGKSEEQINEYFKEEEQKGSLFPVAMMYWYKSSMKKKMFEELMRENSNFFEVDNVLEVFARKAQYLALEELIDLMTKSYNKVIETIKENTELNELKLLNPEKLEAKIDSKKKEIISIQNKMYKVVARIRKEYTNRETGKIIIESNKAIKEYKEDIEKINKDMEKLKKISFGKIEELKRFRKKIENQIIAECNEELIKITEFNEIIHASFIEPEFSEEDFEEIKNTTREESREYKNIEKGITFLKTTKKVSIFSNDIHFEKVEKSILNRLNNINNVIINDLYDYINEITRCYNLKLEENKKNKIFEYDELVNQKKSNEVIKKTIEKNTVAIKILEKNSEIAKRMKGGKIKNER